MTHKRQEIKEKVVEMLKANVTENVYKNRYLSLATRDFPAISVYVPDESAEKNKSEEAYRRIARVVITGYVLGKDSIELEESSATDIDDKLDDISTKIENVFNAKFQTLEGTVYNMRLGSTQYFVNAEGDEIIGVAILEYAAEYIDEV